MHRKRIESERGIALIGALLVLVTLGFMATAAVMGSNTDLRISSSFAAANNASAVADAAAEHGIATLTALARAGGDPDSVQILSDSLGGFAYTVSVFSKRESLVSGGEDMNGDGDEDDVVRYDQSFGYPVTATGAPGDEGAPVKWLVARAAGGRSSASVVVEVAKEELKAELDHPLTLSSPLNLTMNGGFEVDGRLYDGDGNLVPSSQLNPPYGSSAESHAAAKDDCNYWKPAVKIPAEGGVNLTGSMESVGHEAFDTDINGETHNIDSEDSLDTFGFTPEALLGVQPGALDSYKKSVADVPDFQNLSGINYVTSGSVPSQISGSGILIVHNPNFDVKKYDCLSFPETCDLSYALRAENQPMTLRINSNGSFKGIIITDHLIRLNGNFEMLGALASLSTLTMNIPANGGGYVRWSCQAVTEAINQAADYGIVLRWGHVLD